MGYWPVACIGWWNKYKVNNVMEIKEKVFEIVAECLEKNVSDLTMVTDMDEVEEWDSMRNVMILSRLEEEFDIMIPEDDIFDLVTVGAIVEEIEKIKAEG